MRQTLERKPIYRSLRKREKERKKCIKDKMTARDNEKKSIYNAPPDQRPDKEKKKRKTHLPHSDRKDQY